MAQITILEVGGCYEVWYGIDGTSSADPDYSLCIAATEIAEGGSRQRAIAQARADLEDALMQIKIAEGGL